MTDLFFQAGSIANYTNKVNTVTGKNLEVALTELDIRASSLPVSYEQQVQQKTDYRDAVGACVTSDGCIGITLWDFDDRSVLFKEFWIALTQSVDILGCLIRLRDKATLFRGSCQRMLHTLLRKSRSTVSWRVLASENPMAILVEMR